MSKAFDQLYDFLNNQMRMSHIYQPAMLIQLLQNGGKASITDIAKAILTRDPTQVEYYEAITKRYPGPVLSRNRRITEKAGDSYYLKDFYELTNEEVVTLIELCQEKLDKFLKKEGAGPFVHRAMSIGYIPGSLKYEVLSRASHRCQLCGISSKLKHLEVDHIVPRKHGGKDDISNLQALCYTCNAMKRDTDDTDFRGVIDSYGHRKAGCEFCDPISESVLSMDELSYSMSAPSPISKGHTLFVPKRHVEDYFNLYQPELNAIQRNLEDGRKRLQESDASIAGFNIGFDSRPDSGESASHFHLHMIPRRSGDSSFLRGSLTGVSSHGQRIG